MIRDLANIKSFDDIRLFYFKYKDSPEFSFTGVALIILVSFFIVWKVIIPQTSDWYSMQNEIKLTKGRITQLQANQTTISNLNSSSLEEQYSVATKALPFQKDYSGLIEAIDQATLVSAMKRDDYSLEVGNLSTKSAQLSPQTTISVMVKLEGDPAKLKKFIDSLTTTLPLSEVISITFDNNSANVEINFFYKFLPTSLQIPYTDPIRTINAKNQALLDTLKSWQDNQLKTAAPNFVPSGEASPSGT